MIKICTIDLDGTLFDKNKNISNENIIAIKKAKELGCKIVIASGRPFCGVKPVLEKLGLTTTDDYVICYNGAKILNVGLNKEIYLSSLDHNDLLKIYEQSMLFNSYCHAFRKDEALLCSKPNPYTDVEMRINKIEAKYVDFKSLTPDLYLKVMIVDNKERLDFIENNIDSNIITTYSMVRSSDIFLEFLNKKTDKGLALERLANYLNVNMTDTMAIGDAGNDLNMIIKAGTGVAMANAFDYVKKAANFITLDNESSGVSYAITKFILS